MMCFLYTSTPEDYWFKWALLTSVLIHGWFLFGLSDNSPKMQTTATHSAIKVSLSLLKQQAESRALAEIKAIPAPKKKPVPLLKKDPERKNRDKLKPVVPVKQKPKKPSQQQHLARAPTLAAKVIRGDDNKTLEVKQRYLSRLLTHIEGYKFYPAIARRRGIEGNINVSFRLLHTGYINNLNVTNGPLILRQAAERAIVQALPMPIPPPEINISEKIRFVMQYQLQ